MVRITERVARGLSGSATLNADPLHPYRRHSSPTVDEKDARVTRRNHPIAPVWVGECLRLAGDATPHALILRQREGARTALSYSYLAAVKINPSEGINIEFVGHSVQLRGRRLGAVFEAIAAHRAMELAEGRSDFDEGNEAPFIETIAIVGTQER